MKLRLLCLALVVALAGCNEGDTVDDYAANRELDSPVQVDQPAQPVSSSLGAEKMLTRSAGSDGAVNELATDTQASMPRRVAEVQRWQFEIAPERLQSVWESHREACTALANACEIIQANLALRGPDQGARSATLQLRVARDQLDGFLGAIDASGVQPIEKNVSREDRTLQWTDLQARRQSAEQLRDRLQSMVAHHQTDKLADLLALERELNRVQSSLDSMTAQSRVLAGETERVRFDINYRSAPRTLASDVWSPIRNAWHDMGKTFTQSVAAAMIFVASALPWIVILVPGWLLLRKFWSALRRRLGQGVGRKS